MKISELIEKLKGYDSDAVITIFDGFSMEYKTIDLDSFKIMYVNSEYGDKKVTLVPDKSKDNIKVLYCSLEDIV